MQRCGCRILQTHILQKASNLANFRQNYTTVAKEGAVTVNQLDGLKLPEVPTTCCMSGCANCVWIQYAEDLSKIIGSSGPSEARKIIMEQVTDPNLKAYLLTELSFLHKKLS